MLAAENPKPSFQEALTFWLKLGFISFGGPAGQIAIMHQTLVEEKRWISNSRFMHALNYCMLLPGPEAQQLATYLGWSLHGIRGGIVAGLLFILPATFILWALSLAYVMFGNLPWVEAFFSGLKPAVLGIIILALIRIGRKSLTTPFHYGVAIASFIAIFFLNIPFPLIVIGALVLGAIRYRNMGTKDDVQLDKVGTSSEGSVAPREIKKSLVTAVVGIVLWTAPFIAFVLLEVSPFWPSLAIFFTKAALVTFGGAYAVLPYVAQQAVDARSWLTKLEMIDGLALGETTPGPLVIVLLFVGFMAAHNHNQGSLLWGSAGLWTTAYFTFLPSFLFIFIGAPFVERTAGNRSLNAVLSLVTAAVVGVMLNLTVYLGNALVHEPDTLWYFPMVWTIVTLIALSTGKVNLIFWILISAVAGWINALIL